MTDMDYTDFSIGETRYRDRVKHIFDSTLNEKEEIAKYNKVRSSAQRIIDILTSDTN